MILKGLFSTCRCGHLRSEHKGMSGPNSIGQWNFGECVYGSKVVRPYRIGGCSCRGFRRSLLMRFKEVSE